MGKAKRTHQEQDRLLCKDKTRPADLRLDLAHHELEKGQHNSNRCWYSNT